MNQNVLRQFLVGVSVQLYVPIEVRDGKQPGVFGGYLVDIGVNAADSEAARVYAGEKIRDGIVEWPESDCAEIHLSDINPDIAKHCRNPEQAGVWYMGSRFLFVTPASRRGQSLTVDSAEKPGH